MRSAPAARAGHKQRGEDAPEAASTMLPLLRGATGRVEQGWKGIPAGLPLPALCTWPGLERPLAALLKACGSSMGVMLLPRMKATNKGMMQGMSVSVGCDGGHIVA